MSNTCKAEVFNGTRKGQLCGKPASPCGYCGSHMYMKNVNSTKSTGATICRKLKYGCHNPVEPYLLERGITICEHHYKIEAGVDKIEWCEWKDCKTIAKDSGYCLVHAPKAVAIQTAESNGMVLCTNCKKTEVNAEVGKMCEECKEKKKEAARQYRAKKLAEKYPA